METHVAGHDLQTKMIKGQQPQLSLIDIELMNGARFGVYRYFRGRSPYGQSIVRGDEVDAGFFDKEKIRIAFDGIGFIKKSIVQKIYQPRGKEKTTSFIRWTVGDDVFRQDLRWNGLSNDAVVAIRHQKGQEQTHPSAPIGDADIWEIPKRCRCHKQCQKPVPNPAVKHVQADQLAVVLECVDIHRGNDRIG